MRIITQLYIVLSAYNFFFWRYKLLQPSVYLQHTTVHMSFFPPVWA